MADPTASASKNTTVVDVTNPLTTKTTLTTKEKKKKKKKKPKNSVKTLMKAIRKQQREDILLHDKSARVRAAQAQLNDTLLNGRADFERVDKI